MQGRPTSAESPAKSRHADSYEAHPPERPASLNLHEWTKRNVEAIAQLEADAAKAWTHPIADAVTRVFGSMPSVVVHVIVFALWLTANVLLPEARRFDPFPFPLLAMLVAMEALMVGLFILLAENRQRILDERRASLGLQINLLAEQENTRILQLLSAIAQRAGVDVAAPDHAIALEQNMRPEEVLAQIDEAQPAGRAGGKPAG
jgi:uncharacterized membrane protein